MSLGMHQVTVARGSRGGIEAKLELVTQDPRFHRAHAAANEFSAVVDMARQAPGVLPAMDASGRSLEAGPWASHRSQVADIRARVIQDSAEIQRVVNDADRAWHNRLKVFALGAAAGRIKGLDSTEYGRDRALLGWGEHKRTVHDAAASAIAYPGLVAQLAIQEFVDLPPSNFNRIFRRVAGARNLMPGIAQYQIARSEGIGQAGAIADGQKDKFNVFTIGTDVENRWCEFYGLVVEEHYIQSLRALLPGQPVIGMETALVRVAAAMSAAENKLQWAGAGAGKLGFLDMPEVQYQDGGTVPAEGLQILEKIATAVAELLSTTKSIFQPDTLIISQYLRGQMVKAMGDGAGAMIGETVLSFLRTKMGPDLGITAVEFAWEMDNLRAPADSVTNLDGTTNYTGIWIGRRDDVQRVEILPTTYLPVVQGNFVQNVPVVGQVGQPYHSTFSPSVIVRFQKV